MLMHIAMFLFGALTGSVAALFLIALVSINNDDYWKD